MVSFYQLFIKYNKTLPKALCTLHRQRGVITQRNSVTLSGDPIPPQASDPLDTYQECPQHVIA